MQKNLAVQKTYAFKVNGYFIRGFSWYHDEPGNINTAKLIVIYDLANISKDKKTLVQSPFPEQRGLRLELFNIGTHVPLTEFLLNSGQNKEDIWDFNYHDIERLVEEDIKKRFGLTV